VAIAMFAIYHGTVPSSPAAWKRPLFDATSFSTATWNGGLTFIRLSPQTSTCQHPHLMVGAMPSFSSHS
jgi:hypothetical protein